MSQPKTPNTPRQEWRKPRLERLGSIRDIAQQGPPRLQGSGQHS
jgi:hypothetical protein